MLKKKRTFLPGDAILWILFMISLISLIWVTDLYRATFIEARYLIALCLSGAVVFTIIFAVFFRSSYAVVATILVNVFIGSILFCVPVLFLNQQFADSEVLTENVVIIKKGSFASGKYSRCSQPYVIVEFDGMEKQLAFFCREIEDVGGSSEVRLSYSRGLFGFFVVRSRYLVE